MIIQVFLRNLMIFSFMFFEPSQTVDYNHILDNDYRFNAEFLQPPVVRPYRLVSYPWQLVYNNHLLPMNFKSLKENTTTKSIVISGRSPNNRHNSNSTVRELSNADVIGIIGLVANYINAVATAVGAVGIVAAVGGLASLIPLGKTGPGAAQFNFVRSLIQGDFTSCSALSGDSGFCTSISHCNTIRGIRRGICSRGGICCTNSLTTCSGTVRLNNSYWHSASTIKSNSICVLTVKLDAAITEQRGPICQLRLDFEKFNISQPNSEGVCENDVFSVGGTNFSVPPICGENKGQHMYLNVPSPVSDVLLSFKFGNSFTGKREWRMKIAMLACTDSLLLSPSGCLQYYSLSAGTVKSFNWADTTDPATRQISNQNYNICFRRESVDKNTLCFTPSVTTNGGKVFSLIGANASAGVAGHPEYSQAIPKDCKNDYLIIPGGYDPFQPGSSSTNFDYRYCGERLNLLPMRNASSIVCTQSRPYRIIYNTNGDEALTDSRDAANFGNLGFSLRYYHINS